MPVVYDDDGYAIPVAPSGPEVAPGGVGNTNTPPVAKKKRESGKIFWFITLKWTHGIHIPMIRQCQSWVRANCKRCTMDLERGEETEYEHMHMQLEMKRRVRFEWFKHHLSPIAHAEVTRNIEAAFTYVTKEETRMWGPWCFPEPLKAPVRDEMEGLTLKPWQIKINEILDGDIDDRLIYWFFDRGYGCGKTTFIKHLLVRRECAYMSNAANKDIAFAWKGEPIVILEFPGAATDDDIPYQAIECLKNGLIFSSKYESGEKLHNRPHVLVFANLRPHPLCGVDFDRFVIINITERAEAPPMGAHDKQAGVASRSPGSLGHGLGLAVTGVIDVIPASDGVDG